jgi:hypothetical protein
VTTGASSVAKAGFGRAGVVSIRKIELTLFEYQTIQMMANWAWFVNGKSLAQVCCQNF